MSSVPLSARLLERNGSKQRLAQLNMIDSSLASSILAGDHFFSRLLSVIMNC